MPKMQRRKVIAKKGGLIFLFWFRVLTRVITQEHAFCLLLFLCFFSPSVGGLKLLCALPHFCVVWQRGHSRHGATSSFLLNAGDRTMTSNNGKPFLKFSLPDAAR